MHAPSVMEENEQQLATMRTHHSRLKAQVEEVVQCSFTALELLKPLGYGICKSKGACSISTITE